MKELAMGPPATRRPELGMVFDVLMDWSSDLYEDIPEEERRAVCLYIAMNVREEALKMFKALVRPQLLESGL